MLQQAAKAEEKAAAALTAKQAAAASQQILGKEVAVLKTEITRLEQAIHQLTGEVLQPSTIMRLPLKACHSET